MCPSPRPHPTTVCPPTCQKPVPELTVLSGSTTVRLSPQTYCFDASHCRFPKSRVDTIRARPGASLLVDVPRDVAGRAWSVISAVQRSDGTFRTISGADYASTNVRGRHTTSVLVPNGVGTYYLVVTQKSASANGSWVAEVSIAR